RTPQTSTSKSIVRVIFVLPSHGNPAAPTAAGAAKNRGNIGDSPMRRNEAGTSGPCLRGFEAPPTYASVPGRLGPEEHHQLELGVAGQGEADLLVGSQPLLRMVELPHAALSRQDGMLQPEPCKNGASPDQVPDQQCHVGIVGIGTELGAELR